MGGSSLQSFHAEDARRIWTDVDRGARGVGAKRSLSSCTKKPTPRLLRFCTSVFLKACFFWREREWKETARSETVFVRAKFYRGLKNLETYPRKRTSLRMIHWKLEGLWLGMFQLKTTSFFWTHEVAACENRSFFESCCLGQDIATGMAKNACGASNSSMLMLSKITHKLWSPIFFRINMEPQGHRIFFPRKKSTQPKLLTFPQGLVLMVAMMRRPRWLRMGRSLQTIGWLEGSHLEPGKVVSKKDPETDFVSVIPSKSYGASISGHKALS